MIVLDVPVPLITAAPAPTSASSLAASAVVTEEVNAQAPGFPVEIDSLKEKRVRIVQFPEGSFLVDVLGQRAGEVVAEFVVDVRVREHFL